jgi:geranylgeranyl diphosphate synthase type II
MLMKASSESSRQQQLQEAATFQEVRDFLGECRTLVDARLDRLVPSEAVEPHHIHQAIRWSLFAGGKRLRPALLLATGRAFGARTERLLDTACALEMIHTYSLIHDDLPSMDDDNLRRGRPTCHVRFGEATAILAGDALQTLAFQTIASAQILTPETRVRLIIEAAHASGTPDGMVAGQAYDLAAESNPVTGDELERIHGHKTGALISASARCGAIIADVPEDGLRAVTVYASHLGLLFQITDDLLDVTATADDLGKTPGKDERASKATYPALYGLGATRERAQAVYLKTCEALETVGERAPLLRGIARFILERQA